MHLLPALMGAAGGVAQATRSACGPFLGLAPYLPGNAVYSSCLDFNDSVISYIEQSPWIETVILASALSFIVKTSVWSDATTRTKTPTSRMLRRPPMRRLIGFRRSAKRSCWSLPRPMPDSISGRAKNDEHKACFRSERSQTASSPSKRPILPAHLNFIFLTSCP